MKLVDRESALTERQTDLLSYWTSLCDGQSIPARRELNPARLRGALAHTSLAEKSGDKFSFRLTGSRIAALFGRNAERQLIDEIDANIAEAGSSSMDLALETGRPVIGSRRVGARWHCWVRVPLVNDQGKAALVLCLDEFPAELQQAELDAYLFEDKQNQIVA